MDYRGVAAPKDIYGMKVLYHFIGEINQNQSEVHICPEIRIEKFSGKRMNIVT